MSGVLTIDADGVRAVANALGEMEGRLHQETDQLEAAYARLQSALQYEDFEVGAQVQRALAYLQDVVQAGVDSPEAVADGSGRCAAHGKRY